MLSFETSIPFFVFLLCLRLGQCFLACLMSLYLFLMSKSPDPMNFPKLSLVLSMACAAMALAYFIEWGFSLAGMRTYLGFVANARTLAIVRFRAPTLYIKRRDVLAVVDEGDSVRLRDGRIIRLARGIADDRRYRSEFRNPFYKQWGNQRPVLAGALRVEENT